MVLFTCLCFDVCRVLSKLLVSDAFNRVGTGFQAIGTRALAQVIITYVPMKVALKLGLSHVPLAEAALDALESWAANVPPETMQPCYSSVLPLLDGYLKSHLNLSEDAHLRPLLFQTKSGVIEKETRLLLLPDKDDGVWEVMSSVSTTSHRGYNRVMTKLLKKSSQLVSVLGGRVLVSRVRR